MNVDYSKQISFGSGGGKGALNALLSLVWCNCPPSPPTHTQDDYSISCCMHMHSPMNCDNNILLCSLKAGVDPEQGFFTHEVYSDDLFFKLATAAADITSNTLDTFFCRNNELLVLLLYIVNAHFQIVQWKLC